MIWGGRRPIFGRVTTAEGRSRRTRDAANHLSTGLAGSSRYDVTGPTWGPWADHESRCQCSVCR